MLKLNLKFFNEKSSGKLGHIDVNFLNQDNKYLGTKEKPFTKFTNLSTTSTVVLV